MQVCDLFQFIFHFLSSLKLYMNKSFKSHYLLKLQTLLNKMVLANSTFFYKRFLFYFIIKHQDKEKVRT